MTTPLSERMLSDGMYPGIVEKWAEEVRGLEQARHLAEAKVLSRDAIVQQLSETQLAKDVADAETRLQVAGQVMRAAIARYPVSPFEAKEFLVAFLAQKHVVP